MSDEPRSVTNQPAAPAEVRPRPISPEEADEVAGGGFFASGGREEEPDPAKPPGSGG